MTLIVKAEACLGRNVRVVGTEIFRDYRVLHLMYNLDWITEHHINCLNEKEIESFFYSVDWNLNQS